MKSRSALSLNRPASKSSPVSLFGAGRSTTPIACLLRSPSEGRQLHNCSRCRIPKHFPKKTLFPLDGTPRRTIFVIPLEAGPEAFRGGSRTFGTTNWNSILSRRDAQPFATADRLRIMVGARIEFFDARKTRGNRWFFEIYIQGSKYNFLELSLKHSASVQTGARESFSYHKRFPVPQIHWIGGARRRLIKLQRAHNGCLGANRR